MIDKMAINIAFLKNHRQSERLQIRQTSTNTTTKSKRDQQVLYDRNVRGKNGRSIQEYKKPKMLKDVNSSGHL